MAAVRAIWSCAAFAMLYAMQLGKAMTACGEPTMTTLPPCLCRII